MLFLQAYLLAGARASDSGRMSHDSAPLTTDTTPAWDVIVLGGGPAGLSTALTLVRARRRVLVLDGGAPRNRFAAHMHGVLGHDGKAPGALLATGRDEVERYGGTVRVDDVVRTGRDGELFAVETTSGATHRARRLVVATGVHDVLPDLPGLREQWGRGVVVCPYCDGYEVRDRRIGVLATGPNSPAYAQMIRQWSPTVTYLADAVGVPEGEDLLGFEARGIEVVPGPVERALERDSRLVGVEMADGRTVELDVIFTHPHSVPRDEPLRQLGAERADGPMGSFVTVDAMGRTSVDGVWAVGNVVNLAANVAMSVGAGAFAGGAVNLDLVQEDVRDAVAVGSPLSDTRA